MDNLKFDEHGRVIPDKQLRKEFFFVASRDAFTNRNKGALLVVVDTVNDDAYLATFVKMQSASEKDGDRFEILRGYGQKPYWVDAYKCVAVSKRVYDYLHEAFPNLIYVDMQYIVRQ